MRAFDSSNKILLCILSAIGIASLVAFAIFRLPEALDGRSPEDFPNYYFAGKRIFAGQSPYGSIAGEVKRNLGWEYKAYPADPPGALIVLAPLSLIEYQHAWWALEIFSLLAYCYVMFGVARELKLNKWLALTACSLGLSSSAFLFLLYRNHFEVLVLLLGFLGWRSLRNRNDTIAGVLWGFAATLKLFPLLWGLPLLAQRHYRAFFSGLVCLVSLVVCSLLVLGIQPLLQFVTEVVPLSEQWQGKVGNYSLLSLGTALFNTKIGWILTGLAAGVLGPMLLSVKKIDFFWPMSLTLALLISPLSWLNYQIFLHPALLILFSKIPVWSLGVRWRFIVLFLVLRSFPEKIQFEREILTILVSYIPIIGMLWLFLWLSKLSLSDRDLAG